MFFSALIFHHIFSSHTDIGVKKTMDMEQSVSLNQCLHKSILSNDALITMKLAKNKAAHVHKLFNKEISCDKEKAEKIKKTFLDCHMHEPAIFSYFEENDEYYLGNISELKGIYLAIKIHYSEMDKKFILDDLNTVTAHANYTFFRYVFDYQLR